ncbi:MAG: RICIN domain-containing protein [Dethiosulfatibacter sp.]|nr:RICIN domain-containing protein [Dethiosulfatibacter sp.]
MIRSLSNSTELYLNIYGNTKADIKSGSNIHLYSYSTSGMSDFQLKKLDNGNYIIMYDDLNSLVLTGDGTAKGANVILKTYTGSNLQQWKLLEVE